MTIPDQPKQFFEEFFPVQFREHRDLFDVGQDSSAVSFVVDGAGVWTFQIRDGELEVEPDKSPRALMQVVFSHEDFKAVVVRKAKDDYRRTGRITNDSLGPFRLLFSMERKRGFFEREKGSLLFVIDDKGERRKMHIVPGSGPAPERARTVFQLKLPDLLSLFNKEKTGVALFMLRKMKIKGDMAFAMKANGLLS